MFSAENPLPKTLYIVGLIVIFLAAYSQYIVHLGPILGYFVVYGIPILVVTLIFGKSILKKAAKNNKAAFKYGLSLFGALTVLGIFLAAIVVAILLQVDPQAATLLSKPNPVLDVPPNVAWIMIAVSFLVVGPAEEYLFRGFMYGGLLSVSRGRHWLPLAVISSFMFAAVHAYYAVTYGVASSAAFIDLVCFGIAMAVTYFWTGGNILAATLIHGVYDATGFLGVATTTVTSIVARFILIGLGLTLAVIYLPKKIRLTPAQPPPPSSPESTVTLV